MPPAVSRISPRVSALAIALLLILFATVSWSAITSKGATYDEPYHAVSAWLQLRYADYRMDNEDPPLWMYWASLPNGRQALSADFKTSFWTSMPHELVHQWYWGVTTLYRTPGNDPVQLINRCRAMMLTLAVLLGVVIARWAWQIAGPVAGVCAAVLFTLDPNFIAHAALMKNDVVFSLSMLLLAHALWKAGQHLTAWRIVQIALLCVFTLTVKFSGLLSFMIVPALLLLRAMLPVPWKVMSRSINTRASRSLIAIGVVVIAMLTSYAGVWAVYGFRFRPTPQPGVWLNMNDLAWEANRNQIVAAYGDIPPPSVSMQAKPGPVINSVLFANRYGLLPQPFLAGFLFTYANALMRPAYANGHVSVVGWWWYFPFAMAVKTPLATWIAGLGSFIVIYRTFRRGKSITALGSISNHTGAIATSPAIQSTELPRDLPHIRHWNTLCLGLPFAMFLASAMKSNFNIGLRHILPIYPFAFITAGCVAATLWNSPLFRKFLVIVGLLLAIESYSTYPNFIPFFNAIASNAPGGKLHLLTDSNLDWGQDLPLLAAWQHDHPDVPLYLSYFGYTDPVYYHIKYHPLPGGYHFDPKPVEINPYQRSVLAISATNLQGGLLPPALRPVYQAWSHLPLIATLGESIYLFDYNPQGLPPLNAAP